MQRGASSRHQTGVSLCARSASRRCARDGFRFSSKAGASARLPTGLVRGGGRHVGVEEGELIGDYPLEELAHVDVEVPDWVAAYLSARCLGRVAQRGLGWGNGVGVADAEEDRALDLTGLAARGVEGDLQRDAGWGLVAVLSL